MRNKYIIGLLSCCCLMLAFTSFIDPEKEPLNKIKRLQLNIFNLNATIEKSKKDKKNVTDQILLVESQLQYRKELLAEIQRQESKIASDLKNLEMENFENIQKYKHLQADYAKVMRIKYIQKLSHNPILSLLNQQTWPQKVGYWYCVGQLERLINDRKIKLNTWQANYSQLHLQLKDMEEQQKSLYATQLDEQKSIEKELHNQKIMLDEVSLNESKLGVELKNKMEEMNKLEEMVLSNIAIAPKKESNIKNHTLHWTEPLQNAILLSRFGHSIPQQNKNIVLRNNGVDMVSSDPFVSLASDAEVIQIRQVQHSSFIVMMRNENVYQVYSNLANVLVKQGEWLKAGNKIGKCLPLSKDQYVLHFEIWKGKVVQKPLHYITLD